jgi:threonine/homoserine/homoserine lactone efflux protein
MLAILFSMSVFALIGAITPGPVNIIATSSGVRFGFVRTLPHVSGATVSYTLIVALVGNGLHQLLSDHPQIIELLKYPGGGFLLYMVDTAQQLGFSDQAHFQRNFKKRVAVTPKRYQSFFC